MLTLMLGAFQNQSTGQSLTSANARADSADKKLGDIQKEIGALTNQNGSLLSAITSIAGKANVNPNQSAKDLANAVIQKLATFQAELDQTNRSVHYLENPPPNPDYIYQDSKKVARFWSGKYLPYQERFLFLKISDANQIDFSRPVDFRGLVLSCEGHGLDAGSEAGSRGEINNVMNNVPCVIVSGSLSAENGSTSSPQ